MTQRKIFIFNYPKLEKLANRDAIKIVKILENYYNGSSYKLKDGSSFLINPGELFFDQNTDILFKSQYIQLAARRSYQHYKDLGYKHLDLTYYPDLNLQAIKYNPLLITENNKIYFKYEE